MSNKNISIYQLSLNRLNDLSNQDIYHKLLEYKNSTDKIIEKICQNISDEPYSNRELLFIILCYNASRDLRDMASMVDRSYKATVYLLEDTISNELYYKVKIMQDDIIKFNNDFKVHSLSHTLSAIRKYKKIAVDISNNVASYIDEAKLNNEEELLF